MFMVLFARSTVGQPPPRSFMRGLSIQAYPAGVIGNGHFTYFLRPQQTITVFLGGNITNRRDWGKHDDERGGGIGPGVGWRYYSRDQANGWFCGVRTDLWFLNIDWEDGATRNGNTDIVVFQPTAQAGYAFFPVQSRWVFEASASLGAEINIQTRGEPVGEGAILLIGFGASYTF